MKLWFVATFGNGMPPVRWPKELLKDYKARHKKPLDPKRYPIKLVGQKVLERHPIMTSWGELPSTGPIITWADLMFTESRVVVATMLTLMREQGIPSLAVHDSIIVPQSGVDIAATALKESFKAVTNMEAHLTINPQGTLGA